VSLNRSRSLPDEVVSVGLRAGYWDDRVRWPGPKAGVRWHVREEHLWPLIFCILFHLRKKDEEERNVIRVEVKMLINLDQSFSKHPYSNSPFRAKSKSILNKMFLWRDFKNTSYALGCTQRY